MNIDQGKFYRPCEVQRILGIGQTKFYALRNAGEIETKKIGRATVTPGTSLAEFINKIVSAGPPDEGLKADVSNAKATT